jgi:hypothetical protein
MFGLDKYWVFVVPVYAATLIIVVGYWAYLMRRLKDTRVDEGEDMFTSIPQSTFGVPLMNRDRNTRADEGDHDPE